LSAADWVFLAFAAQMVLLIALARSVLARASGITGLASLIVIFSLWRLTDGGQTGTEAWLVLSSLPLIGLGAFFWKRPLGKLSMTLGILLTAALLITWRWAASNQGGVEGTATIVYALLVLVAMVALFMIAGVIGMRVLVERDRAAQARLQQ
jgi:hypothetical protein